MFEKIKKAITEIGHLKGAYTSMVGIDQVKLNVPSDAIYATWVEMAIVPGPVQLTDVKREGVFMVDSIVGIEQATPSPAYMVHNGQELMFTANQQTIFSTPITGIRSLQSMSSLRVSASMTTRQGFICNLHDGQSILIRAIMPVATDATTTFRTAGGASDLTGGWKDELAPYGIEILYANNN